jgi:predicted dehydrogenase
MLGFDIVQTPSLPQRPVPIVSIGAGGIVRHAHYPAYQKAGFHVAGVFDVDAAQARFMADTFNVAQIFSSLEEAISRSPRQVVYDVAVPATAILDVLTRLPEGSVVLMQKPMGESLAEARAIRDLCHHKRLVAAVNFQMRYAPYILAARSLIDAGAIGQIHDMEVRVTVYTPWQLWTFLEGMSYPEIFYHSVHYIDLMRSFLGEPKGVYAKSVAHPCSKLGPTRTNIILDYGSTLRANITTNHHHEYGLRHQESYVKWEGTRGAIKARLGLLMNYPDGEPDQFEYCILATGEEPRWKSVPIKGSWFPDAFIGTMASVMRATEGTSNELPTSVDDALKTMAVVDAVCCSSESGSVSVPIEQD